MNFFQELNIKISVLSKKYSAAIKLEKDTDASVECFTEYLVCILNTWFG